MFSIRLHLLSYPNNRLVWVYYTWNIDEACRKATVHSISLYQQHDTGTCSTVRASSQTAAQVHVETVSKVCVTIWSRHRTTFSTETVPHGCRCPLRSSTGCFGYLSKYYSTYKPLLLICWDCLMTLYRYTLATLSVNYFPRFSTCPGNYTRTTCTHWWTKQPMSKNMSLTREYTECMSRNEISL